MYEVTPEQPDLLDPYPNTIIMPIIPDLLDPYPDTIIIPIIPKVEDHENTIIHFFLFNLSIKSIFL